MQLSESWRSGARAVRSLGRHDLIEGLLVGLAFLFYFLVRGNVVDRATEALQRGVAIIRLEESLGIFWELEMQAWVLSSETLVKLWNNIYFWGHFPAIIAIGFWLYLFRRHCYTLLRNALLLSGGVALVIYSLFPVAPPRLMPQWGFVDTMALYSRANYQAQELQPFVNPFAAVPSLHFGWVFLVGVLLIWFFRRNLLAWVLGIVMPLLQAVAIVVTANHFILDALAGLAVCLVGLGLALALQRWGYPVLRRFLPEAVVLHLTPPQEIRQPSVAVVVDR